MHVMLSHWTVSREHDVAFSAQSIIVVFCLLRLNSRKSRVDRDASLMSSKRFWNCNSSCISSKNCQQKRPRIFNSANCWTPLELSKIAVTPLGFNPWSCSTALKNNWCPLASLLQPIAVKQLTRWGLLWLGAVLSDRLPLFERQPISAWALFLGRSVAVFQSSHFFGTSLSFACVRLSLIFFLITAGTGQSLQR